jgi:cytochrome c peroxidase
MRRVLGARRLVAIAALSVVAAASPATEPATASALATASATASVPLGLPDLPPGSKPASGAVIALGRALFLDRELSVNGTLSCAMCHLPDEGFTANAVRTSVGMAGVSLRRNAPSLLNVAYQRSLFLDGRRTTLESQALEPLLHPDEMANGDIARVLARIAALPGYGQRFRRAFGDPRPTALRVETALAAYQRTLLAGDSPFDQWYFGGREAAIPEAAKRGFALFRERGCIGCHPVDAKAALFTDHGFHNTGTGWRSEVRRRQPVRVELIAGLATELTPSEIARFGTPDAPDLGRHEVTGKDEDRRAFRTPSLRNVAITGPYMHDGSFDTLAQVIDHYAGGGSPDDPAQAPAIRPFALTADERGALLAFLTTLTSPSRPR